MYFVFVLLSYLNLFKEINLAAIATVNLFKAFIPSTY